MTSFNRLAAASPHSAGHVEASDPDIIMRRVATSESTMTPAKTLCESDATPICVPVEITLGFAQAQTRLRTAHVCHRHNRKKILLTRCRN
jgi:hypothetical protein